MATRPLLTKACFALLITGVLASAGTADADAFCEAQPVLTPLAEDTSTDASLFALAAGFEAPDGARVGEWLLVLDASQRQALLYPDALADLRTGASHGPGPFLSASRCGDDCFQPIQWSSDGWRPLGHSIEFDPISSLHFTYERSGAPWLVFHQLTPTKGVLEATAFRWDGVIWRGRGTQFVQGVGSPGATADPDRPSSILSGTGRFDAEAEPSYWLPALPVPSGSPGGHVIALAEGAAAFLTLDSRVLTTADGATWRQERWSPWPNPLGRTDLWSAGVDYSLDRPAESDSGALWLMWNDDRQSSKPTLHLTSWSPSEGWHRDATLALPALPVGVVDHVIHTRADGWLLVGPCRSDHSVSWLDALAVDNGSAAGGLIRIPLAKGWRE